MCGIFGVHYFDSGNFVNPQMVRSATDVMQHRGPDDSGFFIEGNTGLGHRRLSIIDLSSGHQPMANEDGQVIVVYNGEIYNYHEIREDLLSRGHVFLTNCDTEVIVHAYEEWGIDCVQQFNGMFAFLLLDKNRQLLWAVRDRLGIKPLYYYRNNEVFVAASDVKALLQTGIVKSELNENVLDAYFSVGYVPGPETMFRGILKVLPGHFLMIHGQEVIEKEYWDFAGIDNVDEDEESALAQVDSLLKDCVQKRLISDVAVGAFLSGGIDSSLVVGLMDELITPQQVNTFTVAYRQGYSEEKYARCAANHFSTNHHVFYLEPDNFFSSLQTLVRFAEEPIVEPAAIALYHISRLAREHAIVLLSGEGSDEVFAGYYLYQFMAKIDHAQRYLPNVFLSYLPHLCSIFSKKKYQKYLDWVSSPLEKRYQGTSSYLTPSIKQWLYHPDFLHNKSSYLNDRFEYYFQRVSDKDPLRQMLYVDTKTWLVDDLLVKADKMTMAASIELRVPFLDYRLVEAVSALPSSLKIKNKEGKYLVKKIAKSLLPEKIIYRKKMGFSVPTNEWFQEDLMSQVGDIVYGLKKEPWFCGNALEELINRHRIGEEDHSRLLMTLLVFSEWQREYL